MLYFHVNTLETVTITESSVHILHPKIVNVVTVKESSVDVLQPKTVDVVTITESSVDVFQPTIIDLNHETAVTDDDDDVQMLNDQTVDNPKSSLFDETALKDPTKQKTDDTSDNDTYKPLELTTDPINVVQEKLDHNETNTDDESYQYLTRSSQSEETPTDGVKRFEFIVKHATPDSSSVSSNFFYTQNDDEPKDNDNIPEDLSKDIIQSVNEEVTVATEPIVEQQPSDMLKEEESDKYIPSNEEKLDQPVNNGILDVGKGLEELDDAPEHEKGDSNKQNYDSTDDVVIIDQMVTTTFVHTVSSEVIPELKTVQEQEEPVFEQKEEEEEEKEEEVQLIFSHRMKGKHVSQTDSDIEELEPVLISTDCSTTAIPSIDMGIQEKDVVTDVIYDSIGDKKKKPYDEGYSSPRELKTFNVSYTETDIVIDKMDDPIVDDPTEKGLFIFYIYLCICIYIYYCYIRVYIKVF